MIYISVVLVIKYVCIYQCTVTHRSTRCCSVLRCGATSRKVSGAIPDGVRPHCVSWVDSACNRKEYQEYFLDGKGGRCVRSTTLPPFLEIWGASAAWNPAEPAQAYKGTVFPTP